MSIIKYIYKKYLKANKIEAYLIFERYKRKKRFIEEKVRFRGNLLRIPDAVSFAYQIKEIFANEIYKFKSSAKIPVIYDCGANVGISILYFNQLFPNSRIRAFEADEKIFSILKENVGHLENVELFHNAAWINDDMLAFNSEGADSGSLIGDSENKQQVKAIRLKTLLEKENKIDFLKIDIEGAESEVIKDCASSLKNVENIFIEYHSFKNREQDLDEILSVLRRNNFRYFLETINKPSNPFIQVSNQGQMDLQINIFGVKK